MKKLESQPDTQDHYSDLDKQFEEALSKSVVLDNKTEGKVKSDRNLVIYTLSCRYSGDKCKCNCSMILFIDKYSIRRQTIIFNVVKCQAIIRGFLCRHRYKKIKYATTIIQPLFKLSYARLLLLTKSMYFIVMFLLISICLIRKKY